MIPIDFDKLWYWIIDLKFRIICRRQFSMKKDKSAGSQSERHSWYFFLIAFALTLDDDKCYSEF